MRPKEGTPEYFEFMQNVCRAMEKVIPVYFYGMSGYTLSFYWILKDGNRWNTPVSAPLDVLLQISQVDEMKWL